MSRAGQYRHPGAVSVPSDGSKDAYGATPETFSTLATLQFSVRTRSYNETLQDGKFEGLATHLLATPYPGATLANQIKRPARVVIGGRTFKLVAPRSNVDELNRELQLLCEEVVD